MALKHSPSDTSKWNSYYFNLLCSMAPSILKLTGTQELDDRIYRDFKQSFPILGLDFHKFVEDDIKNEVSTEEVKSDICFLIPDVHALPRRRRKEKIGIRTVLHCDKENCSYKSCYLKE